MTTIQTEHNGHAIKYDEGTDIWLCNGIDANAKTLTALKAKINDFDAKERKLGKDGVLLLKIDGYRYSNDLVQKVRATMLDKDINPGDNYATVWISHLSDKQREKVGLHILCLDTPENLAALAEADRLEKEGAALMKKGEKVRADIPRVTVEQIKAMALAVKS